MSQATRVENGVTVFTSTSGKVRALFPRIPLEQYRTVLAGASNPAALRKQLRNLDAAGVRGFRADAQLLLANEIHVTCFEMIKSEKQAGAAFLYRKALTELIAIADAVLGECAATELVGA